MCPYLLILGREVLGTCSECTSRGRGMHLNIGTHCRAGIETQTATLPTCILCDMTQAKSIQTPEKFDPFPCPPPALALFQCHVSCKPPRNDDPDR